MYSLFKKRKVIAFLILLVMLTLCIPSTHAADDSDEPRTIPETENNNTYSNANLTEDNANNTGTMSSAADVDWWKVSFAQDGWANYWLGNIKPGNDFDLVLYDSNGTTILEISTNSSNSQELIRYNVIKNRTYYIKIEACNVSSSNAKTYTFRAKVYDSAKGYVFTYNQVNDLNTTLSGTTVMQDIWDMGYDGPEYINNSAASVYSSLPKADIFVYNYHGLTGGGAVVCRNSSGTKSYIYAKNGSNNICNISSLSNAELVIWLSCYSGATSTDYGNLVDETLKKGAQCSIGWQYETYETANKRWLESFVASIEQGETISVAMDDADSYMNLLYGSDDDLTVLTNMSSYYVGSSKLNQVIG